MQWKTITTYVDVETGELMKEDEIKGYIKIRKIKKIEINERYQRGYIKYTIECRRAERTQGTLF